MELAMSGFSKAHVDREYKVSVLVVDDEEISRKAAVLLCRENFRDLQSVDLNFAEASSIKDALNKIVETTYHVVLLDRDLGRDEQGNPIDAIKYIPEIHMIQPFTEIIMLTANEEPLEIVKAMQKGAANYLLKNNSPESRAYKCNVIRNALVNAKTKLQQARLGKEDRYLDSDYICISPVMNQQKMKLEALAECNRPVLIQGPSGLGKGATARELNKYRAKYLEVDSRPFFNLNIAAMGNDLIQSELFGHEAFAFTGAGNKPKPGYFELANGGDLFLDEIGDATPELQTRLLKVIEEREFQRIGGSKTLKTTARVIFASNKDLKQLVNEGKFKADLYARISTFEIHMPTLEERKEDIPYIIKSLIEKANRENCSRRIPFEQIPQDLMEYLSRPDVPGAIRGIENDIQRIFLFSPKNPDGTVDTANWKTVLGLTISALRPKRSSGRPMTIQDLLQGPTDFLTSEFPGLKEMKDLIEHACLREANIKFRSQTERAKALKVHPSMISRMKGKYDTAPRGEI
jgi:two-component system response regulator AtoC